MDNDKPEILNKNSDRKNLLLLLVLNTLYHLPKSLTYSFGLHLQGRHISYTDQAKFSWVVYPASCGLLWAPIVDTFYISKFGRRKSWLIPSQLLAGTFYLILCIKMNDWLGNEQLSRKPKISELTVLFLLLNLAAETQRISVSGWSLTLISRQNIVYTGHCKVIGKAVSYVLGYVVCSLLDSTEVYEEWFGTTEKPIILPSLAGYFGFWAVTHLLITIALLFVQEEKVEIAAIKIAFLNKIFVSYQLIWKILKIKPVAVLCIIVFTNEMGFGPSAVGLYKLVDGGITRPKLVLVLIPVSMLFPWCPALFRRYGITIQTMRTYLVLYGFRIFFCFAIDQIILYMPELKNGKSFSKTFYSLLFLSSGFERFCDYFMELIYQGFVAEVSDPTVGGTYVTFINTANDLGKVIPRSVSLWGVEKLNWTKCGYYKIPEGCQTVYQCRTLIDGFHIEVLIGMLYSFLWLAFFGAKTLIRLESLDKSSWLLQPSKIYL